MIAADHVERQRLPRRLTRDRLRVEPGLDARVALALQVLFSIADRHEHVVAALQVASDVETTQGGSRVQSRLAVALEDAPRRAEPVCLGDVSEGHTRIGQQQTGAAPGAARSDPIGLEYEGTHARLRARVRRRAAGQAAANDDDIGRVLAPKPRIVRTPCGGKGVDPG